MIATRAYGIRWGASMQDDRLREEALDYHRLPTPGKLSTKPSKPHSTAHELSLAYSPGVAYPCLEISEDEELAFSYTSKGILWRYQQWDCRTSGWAISEP